LQLKHVGEPVEAVEHALQQADDELRLCEGVVDELREAAHL